MFVYQWFKRTLCMCLDAFCLYIKNDIMDMNVHGKTFFFLAFFVLIGKPRPNTIEFAAIRDVLWVKKRTHTFEWSTFWNWNNSVPFPCQDSPGSTTELQACSPASRVCFFVVQSVIWFFLFSYPLHWNHCRCLNRRPIWLFFHCDDFFFISFMSCSFVLFANSWMWDLANQQRKDKCWKMLVRMPDAE